MAGALLAGMAGSSPAQAAGLPVFADCYTTSLQPAAIDLNCTHADAFLSQLRWKGARARGHFNFPSYDARGGKTLVTLHARVRTGRPAVVAGVRQATWLRVGLAGDRGDRRGLPKHLTYVVTCDQSEGWVRSGIEDAC